MAPRVELLIDGTWTEISDPDLPDVQAPVRITYGRDDRQSQVSYSRCSLELRSKDAKYSLRNPNSALYGLIGRNTPIRVGINHMSDDFDRTVSNGWGTSSSGHEWEIITTFPFDFADPDNFDVDGSAGTMSNVDEAWQVALLPISYGEVEVKVKVRLSSIVDGPFVGLVTHWTDEDSYYRITLDVTFGQLRVDKFHDGSTTSLTGSTASFAIAAATDYWIRASMGRRIRVKAWKDGDPEPDDWTLDFVDDDASGALPPCGRVGLISAGGTNVTAAFQDLTVNSYRFHGEVSEWPPKPYQGEDDTVTIPIVASGPLRRLAKSRTAARSPMFRAATKPSTLDSVAGYWPMEDGAEATSFASGLPDGPPIRFTGEWDLASSTAFPGSNPLPVAGDDAAWAGSIPTRADTTGAVFFRWLLSFPSSGLTNAKTILSIYVTGGNVARFDLVYGTGGNLTLRAVNSSGSQVASSVGAFALDGKTFYLSCELTQDGDDADILVDAAVLSADKTSVDSGVLNFDTFSDVTVGRAYQHTGGNLSGCTVGHIGVANDQDFLFGPLDELVGYYGETAGDRMVRVARDAGIAFQLVGDADDTATMGSQIVGTPLEVLRSCADADGGVLVESRNEFGLTYVALRSLYNQDGPIVDYSAGHIVDMEPTDDDALLVNDVTAHRVGAAGTRGSSARSVLESGQLSIQDPPDGVGSGYEQDMDVAVARDAQLPGIAQWNRHLGTWDEYRFPSVRMSLNSPAWDNDLVAQVLALGIGGRLRVDHPPLWLGPDQVDQMVQGGTEVLGAGAPDEIDLDFVTTPYAPYRVAVYGIDRYEGDGTGLESAIDTDDTALSLTPGTGVVWTHADGDFDINVGGERMTVTAVTVGLQNHHVFTVTRSVNGVVKSHPAGTPVRLWKQARYAL